MSPRDNGGFTAGDGFAKPFSEWQLECVEFIDCWMELAGTPCITLVSISPANGATAARTFDGPGARWSGLRSNKTWSATAILK